MLDQFLNLSPPTTGPQKKLISQFLDLDGDGTGTINATGDFSGGADIFYIQPPAGDIYRISDLILSIEDGNDTMRWNYYGGIGSELTNGIRVRIQDTGGTIVDLDGGEAIKSNADWGSHCGEINLRVEAIGNDFLNARWSFGESGQHIRLDGDNSERLEVVVNDDFSDLVSQYFKVNGYIEKE